MQLIEMVSSEVEKAARRAFPEVGGVVITPATQAKFGHYQCNSAMKWAKEVGKNPREIAEKVVGELGRGLFEKVEVAGPGFINLTISKDFLSKRVGEVWNAPKMGVEGGERQRVVVEFSSPNIAKEMHVGHLRSTIIGDCLARLMRFLGHDVVRLNHVGDWGTAFGMLIAYMRDEGHVGERVDLSTLMAWYKASKERFDADEAFRTRARLEVVALQGGEESALAAWQSICEISREAFSEIYGILGVEIEERGESFYNPVLPGLIDDLEKRGLIEVSDGAKCLFLEGHKIPLMMQKSDGGFGYDTTDVAAMRHRVEEEKADRIIVVTDAGQSLHFELVYEACVKAGYLDPRKVRFDHVPFGLVLGSDGKKFRTRSGKTEKLIDLLKAAVEAAEKILAERESEMSAEEAAILGIDAVKYADLASNRVGDYVFSYERMLRFEGNTAAFILYAYVRVAGIKRKVGVEKLGGEVVIEHPSEVALAVHLLQFEETLMEMAEELLPNVLTEYLFGLAQKFNGFFRDCRVEGSSEQESRLLLCEAVARTLECGLEILGLKTVSRM